MTATAPHTSASASASGQPWHELGAELTVDAPGVASWVERIPRGERRPFHTHRAPWLTIVISGGTAHVLTPDGAAPEEVELRTGEVKYNALPAGQAVCHALLNTGDTDLVLVAVQLSDGGAPS
jgi:oxalate decarboxylase/phosphoglucose isomerase-like protein (cupin superfamily)